jgi:hypothetical protein
MLHQIDKRYWQGYTLKKSLQRAMMHGGGFNLLQNKWIY